MNRTGLAKCRQRLLARLAESSVVVRNREGIAIERNADALDEVQGAAEREMAIRKLDIESRLLRDVRRAIARIDDETWGVCLRCGEHINPKRLDALPWVPYSIKCQGWADQQEGHEDEYAIFENEAVIVI